MYRKISAVILLCLMFVGCTVTKEVSTQTVETSKIEPIEIIAPPVNHEIELSLTPEDNSSMADTSKIKPYEKVYELEQPAFVESKKDNVKIKSTVKRARVIVNEKTNKAHVSLDIEDEIKTDAKVTDSKTTTNSEKTSEPFYVPFLEAIMWIGFALIGIGFIFVVISTIIKKKIPFFNK